MQPQRPYVPHRSPNKQKPAIRSSDFTVSRPYVPGAGRIDAEGLRLESASGHAGSPISSLPPIQTFLAIPESSLQQPALAEAAYFDETLAPDEELPPVEHFLDPLPAVGEFVAGPSGEGGSFERDEDPFGGDPAGQPGATDWGLTDWQQYDWRSVAALGESVDPDASTAWATTDWEAGPAREKDTPPNAAQAIAMALDQIAQRIRDGELAVPGSGGAGDPAALASTLAALFGIKS